MKRTLSSLLLLGLPALSSPACAQTLTYTGGGTGTASAPVSANFDTAGAFSPNDPAAGGAATYSLLFGGSTSYIATNDLAGAFGLNNLTLSASVAEILAGHPLNFIANGSTLPTIAQNGAGLFTISAPISLSSSLTLSGGGSIALSGGIGGAGSLTKGNASGNGTLYLAGAANTYSGGTVLSRGNIQVTSTAGLGSGPLTLNTGAGRLQLLSVGASNGSTVAFGNNTTVVGSSRIDLNRGENGSYRGNTFALGTLSINGSTLSLTGGSGDNFGVGFGATTVTGAAIFNPTSAWLSLASLAADDTATNPVNVTFQGTNATTITGSVSDSADATKQLSLTESGAGELIFLDANTYSGGTTVSAGTLEAAAASSLGTGNVTVGSSATLKLDDPEALFGTTSLTLSSGATADLNFTGTDTISALSLDGGTSFLPAGTYGASNFGSSFAGTGTVAVAAHDPNYLGMNINGGEATSANFGTIHSLGLGCYRPGVSEDFTNEEPGFDSAIAAGLAVCPNLSPRVKNLGQTLGSNANFPSWYAAWRTFCQDVMTHYQGKIFYYIIDNEPDRVGGSQLYHWNSAVQFARIAFQVAKQVDPRIQIESPPVSSPKQSYLHSMLQGGIANYCDYVGLHMYDTQIDDRYFPAQQIAAPWLWLGEVSVPLSKPISCSENGIDLGTAPSGAPSPRQWGADWLDLDYLQLKRYGYSRAILFDWSGASAGGNVNWGLCVDPTTGAQLQPTYSEIQNNLRVFPFRDGGFESIDDVKRGPWIVYHSAADPYPPLKAAWIDPHYSAGARSGKYCARFYTGWNAAGTTMYLRQIAQNVTPGATYTLSAYAWINGSSGQARLRAEGYDPLHGGAETVATTTTTGSWQLLSVTVQPSTSWIVIDLNATASGVNGDYVNFDDVTLTQTAAPAAPNAPSGFAAYPGSGAIPGITTTPTYDEAQLAWQPVPGATGYHIYRATGGGAYSLILTATGPPYTDPTVAPGTSYSYYVTAVNAIGESAASNTATITASNNQPDLIVTGISWSPANPAAGTPVTFSATVKNIGTAPTPPGTVLGVAFDVDGKQVSYEDNNNLPLAPGATETLTANGGAWTATSGAHTITAIANDVGRILESNMGNNSLSVSLSIP